MCSICCLSIVVKQSCNKCVNWFIDAKCGMLCVACVSPPAFSLHRWVAQQWVNRKQSASVFLAST